ncbi:insulysin, insulin-degrading enzyme (macronuclear) [Tetrahymena thermophila SB210]|uniref:Insulysin, insulin-degrading enzyme n=1 Tax=Tetrahymena thermophila (strain SB210) TaxID=312017 RepID=Q24FK4_TETTS|nr:insulysin, insulin-degrading enzyme [Tetrahymena thermophila SB210]EAS06546.2 insulysin, insulin-degrading enzyme [Tetrahymena thermophila SB210]|eukprot:XP_001026791.2 insulysin, insulin-degrading enzyme [Tetrahymena thermophila SB210]
MENNQQVLAEEDQVQQQAQDQNYDEENCLINNEERVKQVDSRRVSSAKRPKYNNYFVQKVLQMKRPEVLLIVVALILTLAWFEIVCFVKHDHDQMKLKLIQKQQKELSSSSFIQLPHQSQVKTEGVSDDIDQSAELNIQKRVLKDKKQGNNENRHKEINWDELKIKKTLLDQKEYKFMKLQNGIKVLLISDLDTTQSYAALDVKIGSWDEKIPGLAHFLEHMKFIATNQFSHQASGFDMFLANNQGSSNAYTDAIHTNYHYQISSLAFEESLKYFSYMFNKCEFKEEFALKEINAVNSEFINTLSNDNWRIQYVLTFLAKKDTPYNKFTCGSNESLISDKFDLIKELEAFNAKYSADLMSLVLYSNHSIEDLKNFVFKSDFDKIPVVKNKPVNLPKEPFDENVYKKIYKIQLEKQEYKCLQFAVIVDNKDFNNRHDFNDYFKGVLTSSEKGAFYQQMKAKNYISTIDFGRFQRTNHFEAFMLEINLTDDGYENLEEVIRSYFVFVQEFKENVQKENFEEMKHFQQILFDYDSNEDMYEEKISDFADYINYSEEPQYLFLQTRYKNFRKKDFQAYLEKIGDIRKNLIFISSNNFENAKINSKIIPSIDNTFTKGDKYFNTFYDVVVELNEEQLNFLTTKKPEEHSFLYTLDLQLVPKGKIHFYDATKDNSQLIAQKVELPLLEHKVPNFISTSKEEYSQDPFMRNDRNSMFKFGFSQEAWQRILEEKNPDNKFIPVMLINNQNINSFIMLNFDKDEPQTVCKLKLINKSRGLFNSIEQTFNSVYFTAQMRHLEDQYASAFESNYGISFQVTDKDVQMSVYGWNSKFEKVASNFMKNVQEYQPTQDEWNAATDNLVLKIQKDVSDYQIFKYALKETMFSLLDNQFIGSKDRINLIQNSKLEDIEKYKSNLFTATNLDFLFSGNVSPKKSIQYTNTFKNLFQITQADPDQLVDRSFNIVNLQNKYYVYQQLNSKPDDTNSAIVNIYQIGQRSIKNYIYLNLLQDKLDRFFFNFLRTKEGLGYVAGSNIATIGCVDHLTVILQGDQKQPNEINIYIEKGLKQFNKILNKVTEEDFQESITSFKANIENLPVSLEDKITYMWTQIDREKYDFDIRYYFLNQLESEITLQGMKDFYHYHMREYASKLSIQVFSQAKPYDLNDLNVKNYAKNLKEPIIIKSKEDIVNLNQENPYFKCSFKS